MVQKNIKTGMDVLVRRTSYTDFSVTSGMPNYKEYLKYSEYIVKLLEYIADDNDSKYCNENLMYEVLYAERLCDMYCFDSVKSLLSAYKVTKVGTMSGGITYDDLLKLRCACYEFGEKNSGRSNFTYFLIGVSEFLFSIAVIVVFLIIHDVGIIKKIIFFIIPLFILGILNIRISLSGNNDKISSVGMQRDNRSSCMLVKMLSNGIDSLEYNSYEKGSIEYVEYNVNIEFKYEDYLKYREVRNE